MTDKPDLTVEEIEQVTTYFEGRIKLSDRLPPRGAGCIEFWQTVLKVCAAARKGIDPEPSGEREDRIVGGLDFTAGMEWHGGMGTEYQTARDITDTDEDPHKPSPSGSVEGWNVAEPKIDDLISDLEKAASEDPPPVFDKWLYKKAAEALKRMEQELGKRNAYIGDLVEECKHFSEKSDRISQENERLVEALKPFVNSASHTRVFLTSREKMHQDGVALYDAEVEAARAALQGRG